MVEKSIHVIFQGEPFVWLMNEDGSGPLAYPQHVDEAGSVKPMFCLTPSYAHVMSDGSIMQYRTKIGTRDDLVFEGQPNDA